MGNSHQSNSQNPSRNNEGTVTAIVSTFLLLAAWWWKSDSEIECPLANIKYCNFWLYSSFNLISMKWYLHIHDCKCSSSLSTFTQSENLFKMPPKVEFKTLTRKMINYYQLCHCHSNCAKMCSLSKGTK